MGSNASNSVMGGNAGGVASTRAGVAIDLGEGVVSAPSLEGLYPVLLDLARKFTAAHLVYKDSEARRAMVASRVKFGSAIVQLRGQIPHGRWMQLVAELAQRVNISTHTLRRAVTIAANLATSTGELDPVKIARAKEVLAAHKLKRVKKSAGGARIGESQTESSNFARAQNLGGCESGGEDRTNSTNFARARNLDAEETDGLDEMDDDMSLRTLELLSRTSDPDFELPPIVADEAVVDVPSVAMEVTSKGPALPLGAGGEQLTFASLAESATEAIGRVVLSAERAEPAAARALVTTLREAADRIEASVGVANEGVSSMEGADLVAGSGR